MTVKNDLPAKPPVLSIDFDGVLHSYVSGWHGARKIVDKPIPGAIEWLQSLVYDQRDPFVPRYKKFDVCIFSSRSRYWGGRRAMKRYLLANGLRHGELEAIRFPLFKPPSFLHIDDRCLRFAGVFPTEERMLQFRPWRMYMHLGATAHATQADFVYPKDGAVIPSLEAQEVIYGKSQPEYNPLRTLVKYHAVTSLKRLAEMRAAQEENSPEKILSRWEPTDEQRRRIAEGADIFLEQMVFGSPLQPVRMMLGSDEDASRIGEAFFDY